MRSLLEKIKSVEPKIGLLCLIYFLVAQSSMTARATSDSFLLKYFEPADISMMIMAAASLSILLALLSTYLCSKYQAFGAMQIATFGLSIATVISIVCISLFKSQTVLIFSYMICEVTVILPMVLFWGMAVGVLNPSESKKWFGLIGAAGTCGCILAGYTVSLASKSQFVNEVSLGIVAFLLLTANLILYLKGKFFILPSSTLGKIKNTSLVRKFAVLLSSKQSVLMTLLVVCSATVLSVIDINFKFEVRNDQEDLYDFFGLFYTYTSTAQLLLQLLIVRAILTRGGVLVAIGLLPILLSCVSGFAIFFIYKDAIYVSKFFTQVIFFTIEYVGLQMLFLAVSKQLRGQMNSAVDGLTRPATIAIISLLIGYTLPFWQVGSETEIVYRLNLVIVSLSTCWLFVSFLNYKEYLNSLLKMLGSRKIDFSDEVEANLDPKFLSELKKTFRDSTDEEAFFLAEFILQMKISGWGEEFRKCLDKPHEGLREKAYVYFANHVDASKQRDLLENITKESERIQKSYLLAVAECHDSHKYLVAESLISSVSNMVKCMAATVLMNSENLQQSEQGEIQFKKFLHSENKDFHLIALTSLPLLTKKDTSLILSGFLLEDRTNLQKKALHCLNEENLTNLFPRLQEMVSQENSNELIFSKLRDLREKTSQIIEPKLAQSFKDKDEEQLASLIEMKLQVGPLQKSRQTEDYLAFLKDHPKVLELERKYLAGIEKHSPQRELRKWIRNRMDEILVDALNNAHSIIHLPQSPKFKFLALILEERQRDYSALLCEMLDKLRPEIDFDKLFLLALQTDGSSKSEVEEVLKGVLNPVITEKILFIISAKPSIEEEYDFAHFYNCYSTNHSPWLLCGLLMAMYSEDYIEHKQFVLDCLRNKNPIVRETALYVFLEYEKDAEELEEKRQTFRKDASTIVQKLALFQPSPT